MKVSFRIVQALTGPDAGGGSCTMIICECTGTTDGTIRALARDGVKSVAEVTRRCGAGGCCQSCRPTIARILRVTARSESSSSQPLPVAAEPATI